MELSILPLAVRCPLGSSQERTRWSYLLQPWGIVPGLLLPVQTPYVKLRLLFFALRYITWHLHWIAFAILPPSLERYFWSSSQSLFVLLTLNHLKSSAILPTSLLTPNSRLLMNESEAIHSLCQPFPAWCPAKVWDYSSHQIGPMRVVIQHLWEGTRLGK